MPSILVIGADSVIGRELLTRCRAKGLNAWGTTRRFQVAVSQELVHLDLRNDPAEWKLPDTRFDVAVFCAAVTSTAECKANPQETRLVNVTHTVDLARRLSVEGVRIIFLSTDMVFDGRTPFPSTETPVNPQNEYGRQKAEAEALLLMECREVQIVRLSKVIRPGLMPFAGWIEELRAGQLIRPFGDLKFSPISLEFAVSLLVKVIEEWEGTGSLIHGSGVGDVTYADAAYWLAERLGTGAELIRPVSARTVIAELFLPGFVSLGPTDLHFLCGIGGERGIESLSVIL